MTTATPAPSQKEKDDAIAAEKAAEKAHQADLAKAKAAAPDAEEAKKLEAEIAKAKDDLATKEARLKELNKAVVVKHAASSFELGGVKKQLREEGDSNTGKPDVTHVVQQGGGGAAVIGDTGTPIK